MNAKYVEFPKRIKYAKENPVVDFYKKCMKKAFDNPEIANVQVWAFEVNQKDYKKLEALLKKHIKRMYPSLPYKKLQLEKSLILLDIGPRVSKDVVPGLVRINLGELYGDAKSKA
jgi:hypothetical protein